ncbi:hypothetical protein BO94DRAFT_22955 [Aspergillus sclerotioniger CBS 115572]|uniref:Uncharacterized protein n=1 Tax=Aspergillus sclerotioniger CBS 115572 TaxID=1450535 RepID=A0A317X1C5_9EURO|nr:hypothetical protein BO94DRAFT_22955 [Aspergillus sclerotioniger CBS 115572]PWY90340.1 hypothetical protein BO94DRAFT_22955 [Aspergillus sclerotioniger CBS 115572]
MQFKSLFLAFALSASAQAWVIHGYTEKDCKGTADTAADSGSLKTCESFSAKDFKSLKAQPGDYVLTAFAEAKCDGTGYALQPGKCVNTKEVVTYERQFIAITKRDNATILEDHADYFAEFPEEIEEFR